MAATVRADAGDSVLEPRQAVHKPEHTDVNPVVDRTDIIHVKFHDGLRIRLRAGALTDFGTQRVAEVNQLDRRLGGGEWSRVHSIDEDDLEALRQRAQAQLGKAIADMNLEFYYRLPAGADAADTIDAFNALPNVELARPVSLPVPAPTPPNYQSNQGYLNAATAGVDTTCMWQLPNGIGTGVNIADLEYSWNLLHQDLLGATIITAKPGETATDPFSDDNHGTAVLGELISVNNGSGTVGIANGSQMYVVPVYYNVSLYSLAAAVTAATNFFSAGDVILIEQQAIGPNWPGGSSQVGLVPSEWDQSVYSAIQTAIGNGIVVVEAAGNGSQNLDDAVYSTGHGGHWPFLPANDSGALIVGAGARPGGSTTDRSRLSFSNYGATVDLQGWGEGVYSTGYGSLYSAEGKNLWYTASFSGTSSASPIVAGSVAMMQAAHFAATGTYLTATQIRGYLVVTGSPQQSGTFPATQHIGPRPNTSAALVAAVPAFDSNLNSVPDLCEGLAGVQACCFGANGCVDTTVAHCNANAGTPQGAGTTCAGTICTGGPVTEACCFATGTCADHPPATCTAINGFPQGPGTACTSTVCPVTEACCYQGIPATCADQSVSSCQLAGGTPQGSGSNCASAFCKSVVPKFSQPPTQNREDIASNIDMNTFSPNVVVADDFQSDGRPITDVTWWGSYLNASYLPVQYGGLGSPTAIDGWLISFHEPLDGCVPGGSNRGLLGLYFADAAYVTIAPTTIPSCDGHAVYRYTVDLANCCLLHAYPDSRSGFTPATALSFDEQYCYVYDIDIQAVVGTNWYFNTQTGSCTPMSTPNIGLGGPFWGWHATDIEKGFRQAQTTSITMGPNGEWWYGPWSDAQPVCGPLPVNMAFELLTTDPNVPPACTEACCDAFGGCVDDDPVNCTVNGGNSQGPGTFCGLNACPLPVECCLPGGACAFLTVADCVVQGGKTIDTPCMGDGNTNGMDDACEAPDPAYVLEFSLDIGSDVELSDPNADGDEGFDPGDVYARPSRPVFPPGRDGFKDDAAIFGCDPLPDPPAFATPYGPLPGGSVLDYGIYFDLDAHDQIDVDLVGTGMLSPDEPLPLPIPHFPSGCIHTPEHLIISFDDDLPEGWPLGFVPSASPSLSGPIPYGATLQADELVGLEVLPGVLLPPLPLVSVYAAASETMVHPSLAPNPDPLFEDDDDVDSLDIVLSPSDCPMWYFSADHEANLGLDPGSIYLATPGGPIKAIDDVIHLGIPEDADVDAFEFVWMEDPANPGFSSLGVLFSVDSDDPLTPGDESGGLDPTALYVSFLGGISHPALPPQRDDIDAVTAWSASLQSCPGDCLIDGVVDLQDLTAFTNCHFGPGGGLPEIYCACVDFDMDMDVDLVDFAKFQGAFGSTCP